MLRKSAVIAVAVVGAGAVAIGALLAANRYNSKEPAPAASSAGERGKSADKGKAKGKGGAAVAVEAAPARGAKTTLDIRAIGSLRSDESVQIAAEIAGRVETINFVEGGDVNAGDVLVRLDDDLAEAEVADAKARFELAEANNQRARKLAKSGSVTEKAVDEAATSLETSRAALELQRVRLARHVIKAPFSGRVGIRRVSPGSYIAAGTAIVNLEKIDVLKVDFKLPEVFLAAVVVGQTVDVQVDAMPGRSFAGTIYAIDPQVDVNGRAIALRARLPNADLALRPGLFARVLVKGKEARDVVLVPESAIVARGGESFVFRIAGNIATEVRITLGERRGAEVEVLSGLKADEVVVTAGQLKLRSGAAVEVIPASRDPAAGKAGEKRAP